MNRIKKVIAGLGLISLLSSYPMHAEEVQTKTKNSQKCSKWGLKWEPTTIEEKVLEKYGVKEDVKSIDEKIMNCDFFGKRNPDAAFYSMLNEVDTELVTKLLKERNYDKILTMYGKIVERFIEYNLYEIDKDDSINKLYVLFGVCGAAFRGKATVYYNNDMPDKDRLLYLKLSELNLHRALYFKNVPAIHVAIGALYFRSFGDKERGIDEFDKSIKMFEDQNIDDIYYFLAKTLRRKATSGELKCNKTVEIFQQ